MRSFSPRSRRTMDLVGYLLAVLCLNACLGGCNPADSNPLDAGNAKAKGTPHAETAELLGRLLVVLCLTAFLGGCHPSESNGNSGGDLPQLDLIQQGHELVLANACGSCHQSTDQSPGVLSGQMVPRPGTTAYGANLTPDPDTGIGSWTDAQIALAIRVGVDDTGQPLCPTMPQFKNVSDAQMKAIIAYLRSGKAVKAVIPDSACPPLKPRHDNADMASQHAADG